MKIYNHNVLLASLLLSLCYIQSSNAATLNGQIGVELTIGPGCSVTNSSTTPTNIWGNLNFGTYSDLRNTIDGSLGGAGGSAVQVTCSNNLAYSITLNNGQNYTTSRRLKLDGGTPSYIVYRLYSDIARTTEITSSALSFQGSGVQQAIPIYGRILVSDQNGVVSPASGQYKDTITATITW